MTRLAALVLALAACTPQPNHDVIPDVDAHLPGDAARDAAPEAVPDALLVDAPPAPDLSCLGLPPPSTAPDPLPIAGKLFTVDHYQVMPLVGATVVVRARSNDAVLVQATTGTDGAFTATVASGGHPVDAYFTIDSTGFVPSRIDPVDALSGGENALMLVATDAELARWYTDAGTTYTPGEATLVTATTDCARSSIPDTTLAIAPSAAVTYYDASAQRWDPTLAASTNGFTLVPNASTSTVTAHAGPTTFPAHAIAAPSGTLTIAVVTPRS